jgi:hypothetical protein
MNNENKNVDGVFEYVLVSGLAVLISLVIFAVVILTIDSNKDPTTWGIREFGVFVCITILIGIVMLKTLKREEDGEN